MIGLASTELAIAVFCLLENALDAAASGGGGVVTVRTCRVGDIARIEIVDHAGGMPADLAPRASDHFVTTRPGRLGLGIPIARRIANRSGGSVELINVDHGDRVGLQATIVMSGASS